MSFFSTHASLRPSSICVYSKWNGERRYRPNPFNSYQIKSYQSGFLNKNSSKRLKNALELLIYTAKYKTVFVKKTGTNFRYKLNFITLTLPSKQCHPDNIIISSCLSPFLESWAKHRAGFLYVWKAEIQANGNIHFHILSNSFIHYKKLQKRWNKAVEKLGYVSRCKVEDPNSTDVHALQNKRNLASYLITYMNKKDIYSKQLLRYLKTYKKQLSDKERAYNTLPKNYFKHIKRKLNCRAWGASKALCIKPPSMNLEWIEDSVSYKMLVALQGYALKTEYTHLYLLEDIGLENFPEFERHMKEYYSSVMNAQEKNVISESIKEI